jgi:hypothetical protein
LNVSFWQAGYPVKIKNYEDNTYMYYYDSLNYIDLLPGKYSVTVSNFPVDVNIELGKETSIKFGYIKTELQQLGIRHSTANSGYNSWGPGTPAIPINYYDIREGTRNHLIRIKEGETIEFKIDQ